jgi:UDP-N-acetylglucosamine:LPS N-acetylglucosamine transferase
MYNKTKFAIIKPGLGTVEECLMRGIPILTYCKNTFPEFKYNARVINKFKLGYDFKTIGESISFILKNFDDKNFLKSHERRCANLKWRGEKKIEKYLKSQFNF